VGTDQSKSFRKSIKDQKTTIPNMQISTLNNVEGEIVLNPNEMKHLKNNIELFRDNLAIQIIRNLRLQSGIKMILKFLCRSGQSIFQNHAEVIDYLSNKLPPLILTKKALQRLQAETIVSSRRGGGGGAAPAPVRDDDVSNHDHYILFIPYIISEIFGVPGWYHITENAGDIPGYTRLGINGRIYCVVNICPLNIKMFVTPRIDGSVYRTLPVNSYQNPKGKWIFLGKITDVKSFSTFRENIRKWLVTYPYTISSYTIFLDFLSENTDDNWYARKLGWYILDRKDSRFIQVMMENDEKFRSVKATKVVRTHQAALVRGGGVDLGDHGDGHRGGGGGGGGGDSRQVKQQQKQQPGQQPGQQPKRQPGRGRREFNQQMW